MTRPLNGNATIKIDQPDLAKLLATVVVAIEARPQLPVTANVLLEWSKDALRATATSLRMTISTEATCEADNEGSITLPARMLADVLATLDPKRPLTIAINAESMSALIKSGRSESRLSGIAADEFPPLENFEADQTVNLRAPALCSAIRSTAYAAARDSGKPLLEGVHFRFMPDGISLHATDSFRMAYKRIDGSTGLSGTTSISIPSDLVKGIETALSAFTSEVAVSFHSAESQRRLVRLECEGVVVHVQTLDGFYEFSAREALISSIKTTLTLEPDVLVNVLRRAKIFASDGNNYCLIKFAPTGIEIVGRSKERGSATDVIEVEVQGDALEVGGSITYLLEAIGAFGALSKLTFSVSMMGVMPVLVFQSDERPGLLASVSPMAKEQNS